MNKLLVVAVNLSPLGGTVRRMNIWLDEISRQVRCKLLCYPVHRQQVLDILPTPSAGLEIEALESPMGRWKVAGYILFVLILIKTLYREKVDVVLTTLLVSDLATRLTLTIFNIFTRRRISQVIYCAGSPVPVKKLQTLKGRILETAASWAFNKAEATVTISERLRELLINKYRVAPNKITVIPISVICPDLVKQMSGHLHDDFIFGVLCRLTKEKAVDQALEAFGNLTADGLNVQMKIFGIGPESDNLQEKARELGISDRTVFHGWTNDQYEAMISIDCLILPSENEGTPRSILEGGCLCVPTIASRVGGIPDIIQDGQNGWLFSHGDVDALTAIMRRLVNEPEACRVAGEKMRKKVLSEHSAAAETSRLLTLIEGLSTGRSSTVTRSPRT